LSLELLGVKQKSGPG